MCACVCVRERERRGRAEAIMSRCCFVRKGSARIDQLYTLLVDKRTERHLFTFSNGFRIVLPSSDNHKKVVVHFDLQERKEKVIQNLFSLRESETRET